MWVIISGINRMEFCKIEKKTDYDRRFFMTRKQLYFVPCDVLTRMHITEYGKRRKSQAVVIFKENFIVPYDTHDLDYSMDSILSTIDRYKQMTDYSWFKSERPWMSSDSIKKGWTFLTSGTGIAVLVLIWVFLSGGFSQ